MPDQTPGELLFETRNNLGLTRKTVADEVGISPTHLYDLEENRRRPSQGNLAKLCDVIKGPLDKLLDMYGMVDYRLSKELTERAGVKELVRQCIELSDHQVGYLVEFITRAKPHRTAAFHEAIDAAMTSLQAEEDGEVLP